MSATSARRSSCPLDPLILESGERLEGEIKYYDYGVVSILYQLPFSGDWDSLVHLASRWVWDVDFAARVEPMCASGSSAAPSALVKPYTRWLSEDYFIFHVRENRRPAPRRRSHPQSRSCKLRRSCAATAQPLSDRECAEVLQLPISYYENDLAVIGWNAAFLYDSNAGAETAIQLLEYANSQLLEFRHYDDLLTGILDSVYDSLERKPAMLARWRMARSRHPPAHGAARYRRTHRARRQLHQVPERHVCGAALQAGGRQSRRARLQGSGRAEAQNRRGPLPLHGRAVQPGRAASSSKSIVVLILLIELFYLFRGHPS